MDDFNTSPKICFKKKFLAEVNRIKRRRWKIHLFLGMNARINAMTDTLLINEVVLVAKLLENYEIIDKL
jgi:hypothetical protein